MFALPYRLETMLSEAGSETVVTTKCAQCGDPISLVWSGKHIPEHIAKKFRLIGWQFDLRHHRKCICPSCVDAKGDRGHNPNSRLVNFKVPPAPLLPEIQDDVLAAFRCGMSPGEIAAEGGLYLPAVERVLQTA